MLGWAAASAVLLGAVAQASTGFGFGLVAGPFLIAFLGPELGVRQSMLLAAVINLILLIGEHKRLKMKPVLLMAAVSLVMTPFFIWSRTLAHADLLAGIAALATMAGIGMIALGIRRHWMGGSLGAILAGAMSAMMNVAAGIGGPPAVVHALSAGWKPSSIRPNLQLYFLILNILGLYLLGLPPIDGGLGASLGVGLMIGYLIARSVNERSMRVATLVLAAAGAAAAATRALT